MTSIGSQRNYQRLPRVLRDYFLAIVIAVAVALAIRHYVVEAFRIPTSSMFPALHAGDTIFVLKRPYGMRRDPVRGDVVVYTPDANFEYSFIKRVMGVAGDTIEVRNGEIILNGKSLAQNPQIGPSGLACVDERLPEGRSVQICHEKKLIENFGPTRIPTGQIFVIGDMRSPPRGEPRETANYPTYGLVPLKSVRGVAQWIWLSVQPGELTDEGKKSPRIRWERMFRSVE